jgi:hypothetical protein
MATALITTGRLVMYGNYAGFENIPSILISGGSHLQKCSGIGRDHLSFRSQILLMSAFLFSSVFQILLS